MDLSQKNALPILNPNLPKLGFDYDDIKLKRAILIKFLFYDSYNWACYTYNNELANILSNSLLLENHIIKQTPIIGDNV